MKKSSFLFVLLSLLCVVVVTLYAETIPIKGYTTAENGLRVRTGPGFEYDFTQYLSLNTTVSICAVSGDWYKITSPASGYVHSSFVTVTEYGEAPEGELESGLESTAEEEEDLTAELTPEESKKTGRDVNRSAKRATFTKAP